MAVCKLRENLKKKQFASSLVHMKYQALLENVKLSAENFSFI